MLLLGEPKMNKKKKREQRNELYNFFSLSLLQDEEIARSLLFCFILCVTESEGEKEEEEAKSRLCTFAKR